MTNFVTGRRAEAVAAAYLVRQGYQILQQNWRTRYCEIDIIARQADTVHFVEVKYRASSAQGAGLEYITPGKLRQMRFAAQQWLYRHNWRGDCVLSAVGVSGQNFVVEDFIEVLA